MPCSCNKKGTAGAGFEVITPNGKVVYTSTSKPTAQAVSKRYAGSRVEPAGTADKEAVARRQAEHDAPAAT